MGGVIIFDIEINDQINFDYKDLYKNYIDISNVPFGTFNLDCIFVNEKIILNNKEFYKLFLRPNISNEFSTDYFEYVKNNTGSYSTEINMTEGIVQIFIKTNNGIELLKNNNKDFFNFTPFKIINYSNNNIYYSNHNFISINIPANFVDGKKEVVIQYSATYKVNGKYISDHKNRGLIRINHQNIVYYDKYKKDLNVKIFNIIYGRLNYLKNPKKERYFNNLMEANFTFINKPSNINTIDPILNLKYNYKITNNSFISKLGSKFENYINLYLENINKTEYIKLASRITSSYSLDDYYNVKKILEDVTKTNEGYIIQNTNFTNYSFKKNCVEESVNKGTKGILWNPLFYNPVTYTRYIELNSKLFIINYINNFLSQKIYDIDYVKNNEKLKYYFSFSVDIDLINKMVWKNKEKVINYLNGNEKKA